MLTLRGVSNWLKLIVTSSIFVALLFSMSSVGQASDTFQRIMREHVITFGFANEPPYTIAGQGTVTGQDPETLKAVMKMYGVTKYIGVLVEFAGLIPGLQAKRFDVIAAGMDILPTRCQQILFSNPDLVDQQGLAVKKGNSFNLHSLKDIAANPKVRVGVLQGAVQYEYLKIAGVKPEQIFGFPDNTAIFAALRTNRVDAISLDAPLLDGQIAKLRDPNIVRAEPFQAPIGKNGKPVIGYVGVGFRKTDAELRDAFNKGLARLLASGKLAEVIAPFGFTAADVPPPGLTAKQVCSM